MLRFSEEMLLLLLDDKGREFADIPMLSFKYALAGAVLMDLAIEGRIDTDENRLFVTDPTPLEDDLLDPSLARIVESAEEHDTRYWVEQISAQAVEIRERSLARLVQRGVLQREDDYFLWVFQTRRYPVINNQSIQEVKLRIMEVLFSNEIPDVRDIIIISLADVCDIFRTLLSRRELQGVSQRIEQVRRMDLIGREVSKAVRDIESSLAVAMWPMH